MTLDEIEKEMYDIEYEVLGEVHKDKWTEHKLLKLVENDRWYKLSKMREKLYDS